MIGVAIIGSGMAGLGCARRLVQGGLGPVLFDKGRGMGGRVATRRGEGLQFDHGAQYVTAKGAGFAAVLRDLAALGAVGAWPDDATPARARMVGVPGMSALAKGLGAGLDIRQNVQITRVTRVDGAWLLRSSDGADYRAAQVVITVPAPQVAGLLGADHPLVAPLTGVQLAPCLTLMAAVTAPPPFVTRADPDDPLAWIAQDNSKPGRPAGAPFLWVAQAGLAFSARQLELDPAAIAVLMLPLLCDRLRISPDAVTHVTAHRWRYARVTAALGQPFLRDPAGSLYLGGDWCLGPRVEAAWDSGTAIANDLLAQIA